jgi:hypothetical protein
VAGPLSVVRRPLPPPPRGTLKLDPPCWLPCDAVYLYKRGPSLPHGEPLFYAISLQINALISPLDPPRPLIRASNWITAAPRRILSHRRSPPSVSIVLRPALYRLCWNSRPPSPGATGPLCRCHRLSEQPPSSERCRPKPPRR